MQKYIGTYIKEIIKINKIYTVHYFEYSKDYSFEGEKHNFWEFVYVDKGEIIATADNDNILIGSGKIIFHKPNEWHTLRANGEIAPNLVIVSFECKSMAMSFFENRIMSVGQAQKNLISKIIVEYSRAFSTPLGNRSTTSLTRRKDTVIGSEQLLELYISELLILLIRDNDIGQYSVSKSNRISSNLEYILSYMNSRIGKKLSINDICKNAGISKATLDAAFSTELQISPIQYFIALKTDFAKKYIRENNYSITQISEILGYSSVHFFSRQFKLQTGMSPSQYSNSVKALVNIEKEI